MKKLQISKILLMVVCALIIVTSMNVANAAYTSSYSEPNVLIRKGTYGVGVKWVQDMLNHNGYKLTVDGIFGTNTYNAVKRFQSSKGLSVDGIVGPATRRALKNSASSNGSSLLPTFSRNTTSLLGIIKNCKAYYANNNFCYSQATGVRRIPADKSKTYNGVRYVDCSTYVSWSLYEYALINGKTSMEKYFSTQKTSSNFASIGAQGGNSYLKVVSGLSNAKPGDILVTQGHVEFFYSYTKTGTNRVNIKVYNCGSNNSVKVAGLTTSGTTNPSDIQYILRVK